MVVEKVIMGARWLDGKWIKAATETVSNSAHKGSWVNGKWVKETPRMFEEGKVYSKMKPATSTVGTATRPIVREAVHIRFPDLPEGVSLETATIRDWSNIYKSRYEGMRTGTTYPSRNLSVEKTSEYLKRANSRTDLVLVDEVDGWIYRKPLTRIDYIPSFKVLPKERLSLSVNIEPDLITALDSYISKGEVLVNGKLVMKSSIPNAYYKTADDVPGLIGRTDPVTVYFTKNTTKEQLADLKLITESFKDTTKVTSKEDALFASGQLREAYWLSHAKEYSPEETYKLYQRAKELNPQLAKALASKIVNGNQGVGKLPGSSYIFELPSGVSVRCGGFRLSAGQNYTLESIIRDYEKAVGKTGLDITV